MPLTDARRDSPAGKALFKLYDGDFKGKAAGTAYHLKNKDRHDAKVATGWSPPPIGEPRHIQRCSCGHPCLWGPPASRRSPDAALVVHAHAEPRKPPPFERPTVNYPSFGRPKHVQVGGCMRAVPPWPGPQRATPHAHLRSHCGCARLLRRVQAAPVHSVPRRKPASQIMAELEEERQAMRSHRPVPRGATTHVIGGCQPCSADACRAKHVDGEPQAARACVHHLCLRRRRPNAGPLLDDREKERLAALMRYHGKVPELTDEERAAAQAARGKREPLSERQELQRMFDAVVAEVEERRQFLDDMQAAGKLTREMHHQVSRRAHTLCRGGGAVQCPRPLWVFGWTAAGGDRAVCVCVCGWRLVCSQLRTEIQERVDDMARLDQLISDAAR